MNVLVLSQNLSSDQHNLSGAAGIVLNCLITELSRRVQRVILQPILQENRRPLSAAELSLVHETRGSNIKTLEPLFRSDYDKALDKGGFVGFLRRGYSRLFRQMVFYYPAIRLCPLIERRIQEHSADVVLIFYDPAGLAASYKMCVPKLAYYAMPDYAAAKARLADRNLFGVKLAPHKLAVAMLGIKAWEKQHVALMMNCDVAANVCAEHAEYYRGKGHPRALYVPNLWPSTQSSSLNSLSARRNSKAKIFGSLGYMAATGNTYGLKYIGEQIVPRLDSTLGPDGYEIHIFGQGEPVPAVRKVLRSPSIKIRGWVADIDSEIRSSDVFLVANNTGPYRGSHTRFLHAWSLKACCVAHNYNMRANPEMVNRENILLGETADEIAELIVEAIKDQALRRRIGEGGWQTYQTYFTPEVVVGQLVAEMNALVTNKFLRLTDGGRRREP